MIAQRLPHVVRYSDPFSCFRGLGVVDHYMAPPIDIETGIAAYSLEQWRTLDKKTRKALTKEQTQYNTNRLAYLKQIKKEEKKEASILEKQLRQTEATVATEMVQSGATGSAFGGNIMNLLPFAAAGVLLLMIIRRKKS